jgi:hypothetical protein
VRRERGLPATSIAMFGTWDRLCAGIGADRVGDAVCGREALGERWRERFGGARSDDDGAAAVGETTPPESIDQRVFELGLARLRDADLAVLYLAFDESDAAAHSDEYPTYLEVLGRYDAYLRALDAEIRAIEAAGTPVNLVITTDHGRGRGDDWTEHRWNVPGTRDVWLFVRGPGVAARGIVRDGPDRSQRDVRPTIEHLLGLEPARGLLHGEPIREILVP